MKSREKKNKVIYVPKRVGNLYKQMCDIDNIKTAIYDSACGKKRRESIIKILNNVDIYANKITA